MNDIYMYADETETWTTTLPMAVRLYLGEFRVAHWDSASCWGLQVAGYGLWAVQRHIERGDDHYMAAIQPTLATTFLPLGRAKAK